MAGVMNPFEGAAANNEDQRKELLDAIATGGAAGKKAYENAQAEVATTRQGALDRAAQRAQLTGQNLGGEDTARVTETADRFGNYLGAQNAAYQGQLGQIGASGESYLAKVGAMAPFIQSQNINKAADREAGIKAAIAQAQAEAEAKAKAQEEQRNFELYKLGITEQGRNNRANAAKAPKPPSVQAVLGMAQQGVSSMPGLQTEGAPGLPQTKVFGGPRMQIGPATKGTNVAQLPAIRSNVNELATALGTAAGTPNIESIYSPQQQALQEGQYNRYEKATQPVATPDETWLVKNIRGMDKTKAAQALAAPEFQEAGRQAVEYFAVADVGSDGKINDGSAYDGLKPYDAYVKYVFSQPGNKTMKDAAIKYYGVNLPK